VIDQYSLNDRRILPKDGSPISNITSGFLPVWTYGWELSALVYPADYIDTAPYAYYDRWCDDWNVSTEGSTTDTARGFATTAWLAAQTSVAGQAWTWTNATILASSTPNAVGRPVNVTLKVADENLYASRIVWEAEGAEPTFGTTNYSFSPSATGSYWVEAEVQWPDGRRAFATNSVVISATAAANMSRPQTLPTGGFSFLVSGRPQSNVVIQISSDLRTWSPLATNTLPASGSITFTDLISSSGARYYRTVGSP
jgi:hypothetical protein